MDELERRKFRLNCLKVREVVCHDWQVVRQAARCGPHIVDASSLEPPLEQARHLRPPVNDIVVVRDHHELREGITNTLRGARSNAFPHIGWSQRLAYACERNG